MLRGVETLYGYTILAKGGAVGQIYDFLFDEETWEMRYLVINTSIRLSGRKVLIPVFALEHMNQRSRKATVPLTKEQVKNCPGIDTATLMSRQTQHHLNEIYPLFQYWAMSGYVSASLPLPLASNQQSQPRETNTIFRSVEDVANCRIQATDGNIGGIEDIVVDDESWSIRYIVAHPKKWLSGRTFWITPTWVKTIDWEDRQVFLEVSKKHLKNSPDYNSSDEGEREFFQF
jgi:hypothetical protein